MNQRQKAYISGKVNTHNNDWDAIPLVKRYWDIAFTWNNLVCKTSVYQAEESVFPGLPSIWVTCLISWLSTSLVAKQWNTFKRKLKPNPALSLHRNKKIILLISHENVIMAW